MKSKTVFICKQCGNETPRWQGQCPACGAWNSIIEFEDKKTPAAKAAGRSGFSRSAPKKLKEVTGEQEIRFSPGMHELDRRGPRVADFGRRRTWHRQIDAAAADLRVPGKNAADPLCLRRGIGKAD